LSKKMRIIAISPTIECVYLAAQCRDRWDELQIAGRQFVTTRLREWLRDGGIGEAIVIVADVAEPAGVRQLLEKLGGSGVRIRWFARNRSQSLIVACSGLDNVSLELGEEVTDAVNRVYPPRRDFPSIDSRDLRDYLRYKIALAFMRDLDPAPLVEAADVLSTCRDRTFKLATAVPEDVESVEHMREADFPYIEGQSASIKGLKSRILKVAPTDLSVLIIGPTGTGKEAVAFYLHEFSRRRSKPFVSINCAGLQEEFLRSELFGHAKGAFTGASGERAGLVQHANGGTLFLDELGDMQPAIQADLLRFLQSKCYRRMGEDKDRKADIRFVAAAQPDVFEKMKKGEVRQDLFYRVAEIELETPALATVPDDIIRIIRHIAFRLRDDLPPGGVSAEDTIAYFEKEREVLAKYAWPGNVRELSRYVKQRVLLGVDVLAEIRMRSDAACRSLPETRSVFDVASIRPLKDITEGYVREAWKHRGKMTQSALASRLGVSVNTLKKLRGKLT